MSRGYGVKEREGGWGAARRGRAVAITIFLFLLFGSVGCGLGGMARQGEAVKEATPVEVTPVVQGDLVREAELAGQIRGRLEANVAAKVQGRVEKVLVDLGARVHKGQVLALLDASDVKAQLNQAEAAVEVAESALALVEAGPSPAQIKALEAQIAQAQANLESAEADWQRAQLLYEQGAISRQQWEQARTRHQTAKAALEAAQASLEAAKPRPEQIRQAQAQLKQARAAAEAVRRQLANFTLTAPIDGVVTARAVDPGNLVGPGVALFTIVQLDPAVVEVTAGEKEVNFIKVGQKAEVLVPALGKTFAGRVTAVSPGLDQRSGGYRVKVEVPNEAGALKPGMAARVRLALDTLPQRLLVPAAALVDRGHGPTVFVVEDSKAVERVVQVEATGRNLAALKEGVKLGEKVVIRGQEYLHANDPVRVVSPAGGEKP